MQAPAPATTKEFFDPKKIKLTDWDRLAEQVAPKRATRADLVRLVNLFMLHRSQRDGFRRKLLNGRQWQKAVFIARQNRLLDRGVLDDLAKHGVAVR